MITIKSATLFTLSVGGAAAAAAIPTPRHSSQTHAATEDGVVVKTTSGMVSGFVDEASFPDVVQYLGIPYARPPTGNLRFAPPQRLHSNSSRHQRIDATVTPFACPQFETGAPTIWSVDEPWFMNPSPWDEDCLSLSVWAPRSTTSLPNNYTESGSSIDEDGGEESSLLPVLIWIHGEGLQAGSSSVPYQEPQPWIQRSQSHIVVSLQYRLNIFGFPNAIGLDETNLGIMDQRMAIEWVRDNIASFGGNPEQMVLWGQSSGAASVDAQNFAFPDDPIVKGFIQQSGSVLFPVGEALVTEDPTHSNFTFVSEGLGCGGGSDSSGEQQLKCMREDHSAEEIIDFMRDYTLSNKNMSKPMLNFIATPDEKHIFSNYTERYHLGKLSDRPAIFGSTTNEGALMLSFPQNPNTMGPDENLAEMLTLAAFQCPAANSAGLRAQAAKRKTYRYIYAGNFTDVSPRFWEGAYHASDLPQIFGTRGMFHKKSSGGGGAAGGGVSSFEMLTSDSMQDLWLAFARDPEQRNDKSEWREALTGEMLRFGDGDSQEAVQVISESVVDTPCKKAGLGM